MFLLNVILEILKETLLVKAQTRFSLLLNVFVSEIADVAKQQQAY